MTLSSADVSAPRAHLSVRLLTVAVALLAAAWCVREDAQPDLYFHLACGQRILEAGLPDTNVFLAPHPEHPFVAHEWGFQVASALAFGLGGAPLLTLLKTGVVAATLALLARACGPGALRWLLLVPVVLVGGGRFVLRPEVLTLLGVALHLWLLPRLGRARRDRWVLLGFQAVWSNAHGYALLGPALVGAALVGAWLAATPAGRRWFPPPGASPRQLAWLLAGELLVTFLNPAGPAAPLYPLLHLGQSGAAPLPIVELLSPFDPGLTGRPELRLYRAWLLAAPLLVGAGLQARRLPAGVLCMGLGLTVVSLPYVRHLALGAAGLAVLSAPGLRALAERSARAWSERARTWAQRGLAWGGAALALGLTLATFDDRFHETADYDARAGVGLAELTTYPGAAAVLDAAVIGDGGSAAAVGDPGGLFNTFGSGHWLLWRRGARPPRPFICGNLDLYPRAHLTLYHQLLAGELDFTAECRRRGIVWALLDHRVEVPPAFIAALARDPRWVLVQADAHAVLFRRADAGGPAPPPLDLDAFARQARERAGPDEERPELLPLRLLRAVGLLPRRGARPLERLHLARLLLLLDRPQAALALARSAIDLAPADWSPGLAVGAEVERRAGDPARARALLERLTELDPRAASPWLELGQLELRAGRPRAAAQAFARALARAPAPAEERAAEENLLAAWEAARDPVELRRALAARPPRPALAAFYRGAAALLEAELGRAEEAFQAALQADPQLLPALQRLGETRYLAGDLDGASQAYARLTRAAPTDASAWRDLGVVAEQAGDAAAALAAWRRAGEVDPREVLALLYAARLHRARGETFPAQELAREVLRREPGRPEAERLLREGGD